MNIAPVGYTTNFNSNKNIMFCGSIHGIKLSDDAAKEINKITNAVSGLIGKEKQTTVPKIGNKNAVYSKLLRSFEINIEDNKIKMLVSTFRNKLHSVFISERDIPKGKDKIVKAFDIYCGCETAPDPTPAIRYTEYTIGKNAKGVYKKFKSGQRIPNNDREMIAKFLNSISEKLGLNKGV